MTGFRFYLYHLNVSRVCCNDPEGRNHLEQGQFSNRACKDTSVNAKVYVSYISSVSAFVLMWCGVCTSSGITIIKPHKLS